MMTSRACAAFGDTYEAVQFSKPGISRGERRGVPSGKRPPPVIMLNRNEGSDTSSRSNVTGSVAGMAFRTPWRAAPGHAMDGCGAAGPDGEASRTLGHSLAHRVR